MHTSCDACGSSDARYVYKDGSSFCFSCRTALRGSFNPHFAAPAPKKSGVALPDDASHDFPSHVVAWVAKYDITIEELLRHDCYYSASWDQLIYSWKDGEGHTVLWQGRNFRPTAKQKCFTQGTPDDVLPIYYARSTQQCDTLVVVEDPVSAMKVCRHSGSAMPALGSDLSMNKLARTARLPGLSNVVVWLDGNMYPKAQRMAERFKHLGVQAKAVYTEEDPKAVSDIRIQEIVGQSMANV